MNVDVWFDEQSLLVRIIFLLIPFIGWIIELFVRLSVLIKKHSKINIIGLVVFVLLGGFWVLCLVDVISLVISDRLILIEQM